MKRYLDIYKQCMYSALQSAAAYRMNFIISSLITLVGNILFPLVTLLIYRAGTSFPGWSLFEVLLIQSVFTMSSGLRALFSAAFSGPQCRMSVREASRLFL